ncbi:alpha-hydroxy acid oxidase [Streptomyces sp. MBT62]|uniref:alpha-hydroxy acid oxidase n=1 Tax=Streptomyces sp. MBT62 TaxID=2800410 RepID=UPI00190D0DED|nr:alpha-hydroxy acid oxidase [Streptomyces sp. MBT62]MBK3570872.1 alpha-hydroxy-acid oxidizing protein [Streptomyces sp. MBT62]
MSRQALHDFEQAAQARLPSHVWDFIAGGSGTGSMLTANRRTLDRIRLRPRVLTDVSRVDTATTLLGDPVSAPVGIAPMAYHQLAHPEGEVAAARAAGKAGVLLTVSMFASRTLADIAAAASGPLWLQLYWLRHRDALLDLIRRAEETGFRALVLTVDAPRMARRPRDERNGFAVPEGIRAVNLDETLMSASYGGRAGHSAVARHAREQFDASVGWADLAWLRERTSLPLVLKGILTAEDALLAVEHGVSAVLVSNHGGRQLDFAQPAFAALPEIVDAVDGRIQVLVDGSVRYGADVVKALCLGADAALLGRPLLWGLADSGDEGATAVLRTLLDEVEETMALMGASGIGSLSRAGVVRPRVE